MVSALPGPGPQLYCTGVGFSQEQATILSETPLRADGLAAAIAHALADAGCAMHELDFRITDTTGEHYYFKEAALALSRVLRQRKEHFDIWHPTDCVGETGAAVGLIALAVALAACRKGYTLGPNILFHSGNDAGQRAAAVCGTGRRRNGEPGVHQQHGGVLQGGGRQVDLRIPRCVFHAADDTRNTAGRAHSVPQHRHGVRHDQRLDEREDLGQEVMLKNKSYFKRSMGDEAGCATKKGVVTSVNMGKVYYTMWSMDVKIEGENVDRMMDLTTHNHASLPGNSPPWMYLDEMVPPPLDHPCHDEIEAAQGDCKDTKQVNVPGRKGKVRDCSGTDCAKSMACILVPKKADKRLCCHPNHTGHHLIQDNWIKNNKDFPNYLSLRLKAGSPTPAQRASGMVTDEDAPTVCANKTRSPGTLHRNMHNIQGGHVELHMPGQPLANEPWDYGAAKRSVKDCYKDVRNWPRRAVPGVVSRVNSTRSTAETTAARSTHLRQTIWEMTELRC